MLSSPTQRLFAPLMLLLALAIVFALYRTLGGQLAPPPPHKEPSWKWHGGSGMSGWDIVCDAAGNVYAHDADMLYAVDAQGKELWRRRAQIGDDAHINAGKDTLLLGDGSGHVHVLDSRSGEHRWWQHVAQPEPGTNNYYSVGWAYEAPNGNVYFADRQGVQVFDDSGQPQFSIPSRYSGVVLHFDNQSNLYIAGPGSTVQAYDASGALLYQEIQLAGGTFSVCPVDSQVYNHGDHLLIAFSSAGKELWRKELKAAYVSFDDQGNIYCGCGDGTLRAFTPRGRQLWKQELWVSHVNAEGSGPLYVVAGKTSIIALDKQSGRKLWIHESPAQTQQYLGQGINRVVVSAAGTAYFAGLDGRVYAIGP